MPITNDLRGYADTALEQGKQVVGQAVGRANGIVTDLRTQAEKTLNIEAIRAAVEPYLAQAKQYRVTVTERAEGLFDSVKSDQRFAKVVSTAESLTGVVVGTVNERVISPVSSLAGRKATAKPAATKASKPASTRPAAKKTAAKKAPAARTTAPRKSAATKTAPSTDS